MEPLVAALARSLVSAMSTGVWHQVLHAFGESLHAADSEVADELPDDLREARAILLENRQARRSDAEERSAAYLGSRLTMRLAAHPDLAPVLRRLRDDVLNPLLRSSERSAESVSSFSPPRFGVYASGDIVTGDVVQSIDRDQVRDA